MSSRESLGRAALVVVSTLLCFGFAELVVRWSGVAPDVFVLHADRYRLSDNSILKYELQPGARDGAETISQLGIREREVEIPKPIGTARILLAGDSIAYGFGVARKKSLSTSWERLLVLDEQAPACPERVEILNLGVPGYGVTQVVERIRTVGLPLQPDLVAYLYVLNDPSTFNLEYEALKATQENAVDAIRRSANPLLQRSQLYIVLRHALTTQERPYQQLTQQQWEEAKSRAPAWGSIFSGRYESYFHEIHRRGKGWERVQEGLTRLRALTKPLGIPVVVAIMPLSLPEGFGPGYPFHEIHARVAAEAQRTGLLTVDLLPAFAAANGRDLFTDPFHPTARGYAVAAQAMAEWLDQQGCAIYRHSMTRIGR